MAILDYSAGLNQASGNTGGSRALGMMQGLGNLDAQRFNQQQAEKQVTQQQDQETKLQQTRQQGAELLQSGTPDQIAQFGMLNPAVMKDFIQAANFKDQTALGTRVKYAQDILGGNADPVAAINARIQEVELSGGDAQGLKRTLELGPEGIRKAAEKDLAVISPKMYESYRNAIGGDQGIGDQPANVQETIWFNNQTDEVKKSHLKVKRGERLNRDEDLAHKQALSDLEVKTAGKIAGVKATAARTSGLKAEYSKDRRAAQKSLRKLSEVSKLSERATQGIPGQAKLLASRFFPGIDAEDEGALSSAYKSLALDELSKFKGPTTDFEFAVTEDIAGSLGGGASANKARTASLQRAAWFANRQAKQFDKWIDGGHNPDRYAFDMNEVMTFGKGDNSVTLTLQDIQDTAVHNHLSIDDTIKRLKKSKAAN